MDNGAIGTNDLGTLSLLRDLSGYGGYGGGCGGRSGCQTSCSNDLETHSYEQTQSIKDQSTLLNLYQDNKGERRADRIDDKICAVEKDVILGMAATNAKIAECCCETQVALANLNGKVDLNAAVTNGKIELTAANGATAMVNMEARLAAQMAAIQQSNTERELAAIREQNSFNSRCQFPAASSCGK